MIRPPPTPTLFPYTTLFRSDRLAGEVVLVRAAAAGGTRLALAGLRLDALLATREGLLVCGVRGPRSEEHTSELQSRFDLVCRLLLEKKNKEEVPATSRPTPC